MDTKCLLFGTITRVQSFSEAHARSAHKHPFVFGAEERVEVGRLPRVGERYSFVMDGRVVTTSHVRDMTYDDGAVTFTTSNSVYILRLDKVSP